MQKLPEDAAEPAKGVETAGQREEGGGQCRVCRKQPHPGNWIRFRPEKAGQWSRAQLCLKPSGVCCSHARGLDSAATDGEAASSPGGALIAPVALAALACRPIPWGDLLWAGFSAPTFYGSGPGPICDGTSTVETPKPRPRDLQNVVEGQALIHTAQAPQNSSDEHLAWGQGKGDPLLQLPPPSCPRPILPERGFVSRGTGAPTCTSKLGPPSQADVLGLGAHTLTPGLSPTGPRDAHSHRLVCPPEDRPRVNPHKTCATLGPIGSEWSAV